MQREIKFNGWDKFDKKMILWGEILKNEDLLKEILLNSERYIPLQYTGIKDRKKKEIYEGHFIKAVRCKCEGGGWTSRSKERGVVIFDPNWGVKFDCLDGTQRVGDGWKRTYEIAFVEFNDIEILGNIYQNPELLTNKKD